MAKSESKRLIRDYVIALFSATVVALLIRTYFIEAYRMPSRTMSPAIESGDTLFVSKWNYRESTTADLHYGDILVFKFPNDDRIYVKRIVGLPGDIVHVQNGVLSLNQVPRTAYRDSNELCGTETLPNEKGYPICREPPVFSLADQVTLKKDEYYALSDLRSVPNDMKRTQMSGIVRPENVIGRAILIWLSFQPRTQSVPGGDWFQRIRFDRIFKKIQ